jgi:PIN domain nuclease of toxin-antitoxin system
VKLLLDTHVFLWLLNEPEKLSQRALDAYRDRSNTALVSVVSAWETQIKIQIGKLRELKTPLRAALTIERQRNNVDLLGLELDHVFAFGELALHHRDPFDRLLVAQAIAEKAKLVTADPELAKYPVKILW